MADLEADPVEDAPPPPVAEAPPPAAPPADPDPEGTVDQDGVKLVPLKALHDAREERRVLKAKLDEVSGAVQQLRPYVDFLQKNPHLLEAGGARPTPAAQAPDPAEDEPAAELARTLDLYTADGRPDVKRAQKIQGLVRQEAKAQADERVRPMEQSTTRERSQFMYQRALTTQDPDGLKPEKELLDALWSKADPGITATEEGALGVWSMALGMTRMRGGKSAPVSAPPAAPPLHTESPGSRTLSRPSLTSMDEKIATIRGLDTKTYGERTKGFVPRQSNVIED